MNSQFEIESILELTSRGTVYVFAKLLPNCSFSLSDNSKLGNIPIENWADIPRANDKEGNQRTDLFAFVLKNSADKEGIKPGQIVELT